MHRSFLIAATALLLTAGVALGQNAAPPPSADQIQPANITAPQDFANKLTLRASSKSNPASWP